MVKKSLIIAIAAVMIITIAALVAVFYILPKDGWTSNSTKENNFMTGNAVADIKFSDDSPKNVILITLDTVRADHLHYLGYERETTPFLDEFAKDAIVFEKAHSTIPLTTPSHTSMITGLYPAEDGVRKNSMKTSSILLSEILNKNGYTSVAFVSTKILNPLNKGFKPFNFKAEKEYEDNETEFSLESARYNRRDGDNTIEEFSAWLDQANTSKPMFIWVHFYDAHSPYSSEYKGNFGANMTYDAALGALKNKQKKNAVSQEFAQDQIVRLYDGGVYSVDTYTKEVLGELEAKDILSNSIIVIASDHGENLGERNDYFHGKDVYDATTRVPLIIKVPGLKPERVKEDVSLVSITPTILDILKINDGENMTDRSLVPLMTKKENDGFVVIESDLGPAAKINPRMNKNNATKEEDSGIVKDVDRIVGCAKGDLICFDNIIKGRRVAIVQDHKKLIYNGGSSIEFYNLEKDPIEAHNIYQIEDSSAQEASIASWIEFQKDRMKSRNIRQKGIKDNNPRNNTQMVDKEALEALKSLGYIG